MVKSCTSKKNDNYILAKKMAYNNAKCLSPSQCDKNSRVIKESIVALDLIIYLLA